MGDCFVEAARESETDVVPQGAALPEGLYEQLVRAVGGGVVDREDADARVRLRREGLEALAEPLGRVSDREDDEDRRDALGRRGGCDGCTHARFTRAASLAPAASCNGKGARGAPFRDRAPTLSASSRWSSCGPPSSWRDASSWCYSWPRPSSPFSLSGRHAFQAPPFPFAHTPPYAIPFIAAEGVVQTFDADGTLATDPLGLPR